MGRLKNPNTNGTGIACGAELSPVYEAPDGTARVFYRVCTRGATGCDPNNDVFTSKDFWRMERPCGTGSAPACVFSNTGVRYDVSSADQYLFGGVAPIWPTTRIEDPFGNHIDITYEPQSGPFTGGAIDQITDSYGRIISFAYHNTPDGRRLNSFTFNNRTYEYCYTSRNPSASAGADRIAFQGTDCQSGPTQEVCGSALTDTTCGNEFLTRVKPPAGEPFLYDYGYTNTVAQNQYALTQITFPAGGTSTYDYQSRPFYTGREQVPISVVTRRTVAGRGVSPGVWRYDYTSPGPGTAMHVTTITRPDTLKDIHQLFGFGIIEQLNSASATDRFTWKVGLAAKVCHAATTDCSDAMMTEDLDWDINKTKPVADRPFVAPVYSSGNCGFGAWDAKVFAPVMTKRVVRLVGDSTAYTTTYPIADFDGFGQHGTVIEEGTPLSGTAKNTRTTSWTWFYNPRAGGVGFNILRGRPLSQKVCVNGTAAANCFENAWTYAGPNSARDTETKRTVTTTFGYQSTGDLNTVTNALQQRLTLSQYENGIAKDVNYNGAFANHHRRTVWPEGWLKTQADGAGQTTRFDYDAIGRQSKVTPPVGVVTNFDYSPSTSGCSGIAVGAGSMKLTRGSYFRTTNVDGQGRETLSCDAEGIVSSTRYDNMGRKIFTSYPRDNTSCPNCSTVEVGDLTEFDGLGRPTKLTRGCRINSSNQCITSGVGASPDLSTLTYSRANNCVTTTVNRGPMDAPATTQCSTSFGDPAEVRLTKLTDAKGEIWRYDYTPFGDVKTLTAPAAEGNRQFSHNAASQFLDSESSTDRGATAYGPPNALLQVTSSTDARMVTTTYGYREPGPGTQALDKLSRLRSVRYGTGSTDDVTQTYDDANNLRTISSPNGGTFTFGYDRVNRLTSQTWDFGGQTYLTTAVYDAQGCMTSLTYPTGTVVKMTCDTANRPLTVSARFPGTSTDAAIVGDVRNTAKNTAYHPSGRIKSMFYGNNTTTSIGYDDRGRMKSSSAPGVSVLGYGYDGADNMTSFVANGSPRTMSYDELDRLTDAAGPWGAAHYGYDALGNRSTSRPTANLSSQTTWTLQPGKNRIGTATGGATPSKRLTLAWDPAGRVAWSSDGANYRYDGRGRRILKSELVPCPAIPCNGVQSTLYHYDPLGRLVAETDPAGRKIREFFYVGSKLVAVDGAIISEPLAAPPYSSQFRLREWYHTDVLGSVVARTDAAGQVVARLDYLPWGERFALSGAASDRGYNGRVFDSGTGFYDYGARLYFPSTGRFTRTDSARAKWEAPQSSNPYAYALNNPYRYVDPTGLVVVPRDNEGAAAIARAMTNARSRALLVWLQSSPLVYEVWGAARLASEDLKRQNERYGLFIPGQREGTLACAPTGGTILVYTAAARQDKMDLGLVLSHELTHAGIFDLYLLGERTRDGQALPFVIDQFAPLGDVGGELYNEAAPGQFVSPHSAMQVYWEHVYGDEGFK